MTGALRVNRKAEDLDIVRLNSVGLSLGTIADILGCHPTTITLRLKALGVEPADTRRAFMEDIFNELTPAQQKWLADQLGPHLPIKQFIKNMLVEQFINDRPGDLVNGSAQRAA